MRCSGLLVLFVGLMYCYTHKERGIAALVEAMKIPVIEMRVCGSVDYSQSPQLVY